MSSDNSHLVVVSSTESPKKKHVIEFVLGGTAACLAGLFTNPLEVIKTRIQLQGELKTRGKYKVHYKNVFHAFYVVGKNEGILSLQKGLVPAVWYQFFMNGVRLGVFQVIDNSGITRDESGNLILPRSLVAGAVAGCSGALIGSPFYLVKTQLQSRTTATSIAVGHQHNITGFMDAFGKIWRTQGIPGLWRGATGSMMRVTVGSSVQLPTFSKVRSIINEYDILPKDSLTTSFVSATIGGLAVCTAMTPFDVVSTRLYNQPVDPATGKGLKYTGIFDCAFKIFKTEGFFGYYKGWSASLLRLGPHTILSLCFWQEIRKAYKNFEERQSNHATAIAAKTETLGTNAT